MAIDRSVDVSKECFALTAPDGELVCLYGVGEVEGDPSVASIWALGTDRVERYPALFCKTGMKYVAEKLKEYDVLYNRVWKENTTSIRWLGWMGFKFVMDVENEDFLLLWMEA